MLIQTTRFGAVQIEEKDLISFPDGLLGFNLYKKFVLLDDPNDEIFAWLQAVEEPGLAFPVLEPEIFSQTYRVNLSKSENEFLKLVGDAGRRVFTIVTIPNDVTQMTANLKAPVVINVQKRIAKQVVLQENDYQIKFPIFAELQKRVVQNPTGRLKPQAVEQGMAVSVGGPQGQAPKSRGPEVEA